LYGTGRKYSAEPNSTFSLSCRAAAWLGGIVSPVRVRNR
jgi:hypothetical protein